LLLLSGYPRYFGSLLLSLTRNKFSENDMNCYS
jgi:hypothetical protein